MSRLSRRVRRWWRATPQPAAAPGPFQVACLCGAVARGTRARQHQILRCERCGGDVFVLPFSPLMLSGEPAPAAVVPTAKPVPARQRATRSLLIAFALVVLLGNGLLLWVALNMPPRRAVDPEDAPHNPVEARLRSAAAHLEQGEVRLAQGDLAAATDWVRSRPDAVTPEHSWRLRRLGEQVDALADLLAEPLEDLLRHAAALPAAEWQALCARRYRGQAFALDVTLRVVGGHVEHDYRLWVHGEPAVLDLDELEVLRGLPLERPQRVLLACRLADVRRAPNRPWTVTVQPDSGVLFTEPGAAHVCGLDPHADDVRQLLRRQAGWLADR